MLFRNIRVAFFPQISDILQSKRRCLILYNASSVERLQKRVISSKPLLHKQISMHLSPYPLLLTAFLMGCSTVLLQAFHQFYLLVKRLHASDISLNKQCCSTLILMEIFLLHK